MTSTDVLAIDPARLYRLVRVQAACHGSSSSGSRSGCLLRRTRTPQEVHSIWYRSKDRATYGFALIDDSTQELVSGSACSSSVCSIAHAHVIQQRLQPLPSLQALVHTASPTQISLWEQQPGMQFGHMQDTSCTCLCPAGADSQCPPASWNPWPCSRACLLCTSPGGEAAKQHVSRLGLYRKECSCTPAEVLLGAQDDGTRHCIQHVDPYYCLQHDLFYSTPTFASHLDLQPHSDGSRMCGWPPASCVTAVHLYPATTELSRMCGWLPARCVTPRV